MTKTDDTPASTVVGWGEDAIIRLFADGGPPPGPEVVVANGDDAAVYRASAPQVVTTDVLVEGVHFDLAYTPWSSVGGKLVAVNLSDLAAMGAVPRYAVLSCVLAEGLRRDDARALAEGIHSACDAYGVSILGGNVSRTPERTVLTATMIGEAEGARPLTRRGARPGDDLWVTGDLGGPRAALAFLSCSEFASVPGPLLRRLFEPAPRCVFGRQLAVRGLARSMCDVSDGLAQDLNHLLAVDALGCRLQASSLPLAPGVEEVARRVGADPWTWTLEGGEEYELLFAAEPGVREAVSALGRDLGLDVHRIGEVERAGPRRLILMDGSERPIGGGFDHFGGID